ncbi:hypothetical protein [Reinekea blandensis]|uniref:hypothetical protein n=1 Tax=Reinekea blandensis TaxID=374838 RepID=UPI0012B5F36D|nr:hypothetical protein [Reinekea blandensis]
MKRRFWAGTAVVMAVMIAYESLRFLWYLRVQPSLEMSEEATRDLSLAQRDSSLPEPDFSMEPDPDAVSETIVIDAPGRPDGSPTENARLQLLRSEFNYDLDGAENTNDPGVLWGIRADEPRVIEAMILWFYEDPTAFVDLAAVEEDDHYVQAVLRSQINPSNVYLLAERFHIRNRHLINLAYDNQLHIQQPELFVEVFDQFAGSDRISVPASVVAATAQTDYWGHRDELIDLAIHSREPEIFFNALAEQGRDDMASLAQQMWQVHKADDYPEVMASGTGYVERIRLAYRYGVAEAPAALAELQARGLFVEETIARYTDVQNIESRFQSLFSELIYHPDRQVWVHPDHS